MQCVFESKTSESLGWQVHCHGPINERCPGSNQLPFSVATPPSSQPSVNGVSVISQANSPLSSFQVRASSQTPRTWNRPVFSCGTVKHIPKSAQAACAIFMFNKIRNIERNVDNEWAWYSLLTLGERILLAPKRTGARYN